VSSTTKRMTKVREVVRGKPCLRFTGAG
jgi:hypothetical protein